MGWSEVMSFWKYKSTKHIIMLMLEYCEEIQLFQGCAAVHLEYSSNNCIIVKRNGTINSIISLITKQSETFGRISLIEQN